MYASNSAKVCSTPTPPPPQHTHVMSKKQQARRAALEQEITELQKVLGLVSLLLLLKYMTVFSSLNA